MLNSTKISSIIDNIIGNAFDVQLIPEIGGEPVTVVDTDKFKRFLIKYYDWSFLSVTNNPYHEFVQYFRDFIDSNITNFERVYIAMTTEYNPLHNYDKSSEITTETDAYTDTQKNPKIKTTSSGGTSTNTVESSPYDVSEFLNKEKNTSVIPSMYSETDPYNVELDHGKQKNIVTEKTVGNIGVTTSATMATEEYRLRKQNMFNYIVDEFVRQYLYLIDVI